MAAAASENRVEMTAKSIMLRDDRAMLSIVSPSVTITYVTSSLCSHAPADTSMAERGIGEDVVEDVSASRVTSNLHHHPVKRHLDPVRHESPHELLVQQAAVVAEVRGDDAGLVGDRAAAAELFDHSHDAAAVHVVSVVCRLPAAGAVEQCDVERDAVAEHVERRGRVQA